jgi:hypothetical protein
MRSALQLQAEDVVSTRTRTKKCDGGIRRAENDFEWNDDVIFVFLSDARAQDQGMRQAHRQAGPLLLRYKSHYYANTR